MIKCFQFLTDVRSCFNNSIVINAKISNESIFPQSFQYTPQMQRNDEIHHAAIA